METAPKPTLAKRAVAVLKKHERKILIATTVTSTGVAILMHSGIHKHNEFLREHGLFEQFYDLTSPEA